MSLDIKYRPRRYEDVIGQKTITDILKKIVSSGKGFHQSYLFTGPYGSGKTTLARILARALLCSNPVNGEPCDKCDSCVDIIEKGYSECLTEIDAATNSGKESVRQMIETLDYSTFSGKKRLWIVDESHNLTSGSTESLLKVLEDTSYGTEERRMVCIFCTTEPEKMKETIGSRCGPVFSVRSSNTSDVIGRLKSICENEGFKYEIEALRCISDRTCGHIRDAIKLVETLAVMGDVDLKSALEYYGDSLNSKYLEILENIGDTKSLEVSEEILKQVSPGSFYDSLSKIAFQCFQESRGMINLPDYYDKKRMSNVGRVVGTSLLDIVEKFSSRPKKPSKEMVLCDIIAFVVNKEKLTNIDKTEKTCNNSIVVGKVMGESEFASTLKSRLSNIGKQTKQN